MSFKFKALGLASALLMTGCGSGDNAVEGHGGVPFVDFTVNGESYPTEVTVARFHQNYDENTRTNNNGTPDNPDDDFEEIINVFCDPQTYANGTTINDSYPEYCANERSFINATNLGIRFAVRLFNNTYEDFDLTYTGIGFTIRIFEFDNTQPENLGDEVWNSDYEFQRSVEIFRAAGDDEIENHSLETHTITLDPVGIYPDPRQVGSNGYVLYFTGKQNIIDPSPTAVDFDPANLYAWPSATGEYDGSCDWSPVAIEYTDIPNASDPNYERVICDSKALLPYPSVDVPSNYADPIYSQELGEEGYIKFIARVEFNFNNGEFQSPEDIVITITPPPED